MKRRHLVQILLMDLFNISGATRRDGLVLRTIADIVETSARPRPRNNNRPGSHALIVASGLQVYRSLPPRRAAQPARPQVLSMQIDAANYI